MDQRLMRSRDISEWTVLLTGPDRNNRSKQSQAGLNSFGPDFEICLTCSVTSTSGDCWRCWMEDKYKKSLCRTRNKSWSSSCRQRLRLKTNTTLKMQINKKRLRSQVRTLTWSSVINSALCTSSSDTATEPSCSNSRCLVSPWSWVRSFEPIAELIVPPSSSSSSSVVHRRKCDTFRLRLELSDGPCIISEDTRGSRTCCCCCCCWSSSGVKVTLLNRSTRVCSSVWSWSHFFFFFSCSSSPSSGPVAGLALKEMLQLQDQVFFSLYFNVDLVSIYCVASYTSGLHRS